MQAATRLSNLAELKVCSHINCVWFNPSLLWYITQLRALPIWGWDLRLVPVDGAQHRVAREAQEPQELQESDPEESDAEGFDPVQYRPALQRLLTAISQLKQLQSLTLLHLHLPAGLQLQQYSLLTAASQLERLELRGARAPFPLGALQHILRPGGALRQLQRLELFSERPLCNQTFHCVDGEDVGRIATCCPALTSLELSDVVVHGASWAGLTGLRATLQELDVNGAACDDTAMASFAQLTRLSCLECSGGPVTEAGLQYLTALRRLKLLHMSDAIMCSGVARERFVRTAVRLPTGELSLTLQSSPTADSPDVWQQLSHLLTPKGADGV